MAAADAELHVAAQLETWAASHPGHTVAEARDAAIGIVRRSSSAYGKVAAASSGRLYDELASAQGSPSRFRIVDTTDPAYTDEGVRHLANKLRDGDRAGFRAGVSRLAGQQVTRNAQESVVANCDRDGVRWARVPHGSKPCDWCLMLASRGFVYKSARTASAGWHKGCSCAVVPDFDGHTTVQGYDPEALYDEWKGRKGAGKGIPFVSREKGAKPLPKEEYTAGLVASDDCRVVFLKERNANGVKTADALVGGELCEFKVPESWNSKTVKNQMKRSLGKGTGNMLLSGTENGALVDDMAPAVQKLFDDGEFPEITTVWLVDREGGSLIMRRK